jgi:hypothetical protein
MRRATAAVPLLAVVGLAACTVAPQGDASQGEPAQDDALPVQSSAPEPDVVITTENTHSRFSATIPPVATVSPGAVVEVHTKEATDGQFTPTSTVDAVATLDFDPIHPLTGPVRVEGADPGDVLAVTLLEIEVGEWGWAAVAPGFGFLADEFPEPYLQIFEIPAGATHAVFNEPTPCSRRFPRGRTAATWITAT